MLAPKGREARGACGGGAAAGVSGAWPLPEGRVPESAPPRMAGTTEAGACMKPPVPLALKEAGACIDPLVPLLNEVDPTG